MFILGCFKKLLCCFYEGWREHLVRFYIFRIEMMLRKLIMILEKILFKKVKGRYY